MWDAAVPPSAERRPTRLEAFGDVRVDDWHWLRERDDPDVLAYLAAENSYTDAVMASTADLRRELFAELRSHVMEDDTTAPVPWGRWEYLSRTGTDLQYETHVRRPRGNTAPAAEQVILDENVLADGHDFFALGDFAISPDHARLAYSVDLDGSERFSLRVRDLATGVDLPDVVTDVDYGIAWSSDAHHVFYVRSDDAKRPHEVWCHQVGTPPDDDWCVFHEADVRFSVWVRRTRRGRLVLIGTQSRSTSEVHWIDADDARSAPQVVAPRRHGVEYDVDDTGHDLLVCTNLDGATNFMVMRAALGSTDPETWTPFVAHDPTVRIDSAQAFADFVLLHERHAGLERLRILRADGTSETLDMPDAVYSVWPSAMREFDTSVVRFGYSSPITPVTILDHDIATGRRTTVRSVPVPNYDPAEYTTAREWATAPDGTQIPISIVHRRDTPRDATAPLYLYGYGSYEVSIDPVFEADLLPLLDRGWVCATAHVRGGGELGRPWWDAGHLDQKANTFTDFLACADHLVATNWCDGTRIVARGRSAGGLLMGGITHLRPERWNAVVAEVPFVDVVSTMQDESIPLTAGEWEEWGDPRVEADYRTMLAYSPYDNLRAGVAYPTMLVTGGLNDPRVQYWEPAKFVAKLRHLVPDSHVLLHMEMGAGHSGPSGRYDAWHDEAFVLAFVLGVDAERTAARG